MAKHKIDQLMSSYIDGIADKLPVMKFEHVDIVKMTGKELKLTPYDKQVALVDERIYKVPVPRYTIVSHRRQLRRAFVRAGIPGLRGYCDRVINSVKTPEKN